MDETDPLSPSGLENGHSRSGSRVLYRMNSNQSNTSIFENVEMAHDELYSGPIAESLPTSVSAFSHRRPRADSTASFTYYQDDSEEPQNELTYENDGYEDAISDDIGDLVFGVDDDDNSSDIESGRQSGHFALRRRSSTQSRSSVHDRLLRTDSARTTESQYTRGRQSQKVYMVNEDLTIVVAGFRTSPIGLAAYILLSVFSLGLAWLLLRWLPRWHVKLLGCPSALSECDWVVIENQWGELSIMNVEKKLYGRPMSTIFGSSEKTPLLDEEHDPIVTELRMLNYRYVRLYFNQQADCFILFSGWKDPNWADMKSVRLGLDSDEKHVREVVFGNNDIDIEQKSIPRLLVDEVWPISQ
ncbi:membrane protein [Verticillium alfalfae VaMs.102]|uniref:Cation-transporting ATPase n=1 Tax=Verticillium alfalfae (strain VaMs.102 / ATCC MYA-4576 / FGSC 10136) TaxID=526221 RepID=C9S8A0_VERA1|nr:membrane protein [Verticillium alfalfae VaMs.102]EEY13910.1 membrane protein [Verticillium alfalfae VaMs.102]